MRQGLHRSINLACITTHSFYLNASVRQDQPQIMLLLHLFFPNQLR